MDHQREGGKMTSKEEEEDQLQELPFTPVHAPVITLGMNVPRWAAHVAPPQSYLEVKSPRTVSWKSQHLFKTR